MNTKPSLMRMEARSFELMAEYSIDILCRVSLDLHCTYCSPSVTKALGWSAAEMKSFFPSELIHEEDKETIRQAHELLMQQPDCENSPASARVRAKDGSYVWFEFNARLVCDFDDGTPWQVLLNMRDVSERKSFEQRLEALALTDGLTGIGNRRAFDRELRRVATQARLGTNHTTLILLDVDYFKKFNDAYGHLVGDDCLKTIANTLKSCLADQNGFVARYGGEEMAAIFSSNTSGCETQPAEVIREAVERLRIPHSGNPAHACVVTVSVGAATAVVQSGGSVSDLATALVQAADAALYRAKRAGRNQIASSLVMTSPSVEA